MASLTPSRTASPYATVGGPLVERGYHAIPVMPGTKRPGSLTRGEWHGDFNWSRFCDRLPTENETTIWETWDGAGVCVALDHALKVIDFDTDNAAILASLAAVVPPSPVKKRGQKGFSAFYRGSAAIVNQPFDLHLPGDTKPSRVVDLLAHGRQTVMPPTIHPDIGRPYHWIGSDALEDVDLDDLPELPDDIAERIQAALEPYGYTPPIPRGELVGVEASSGPWREVNDLALANLDRWVPDLSLPQTKRSRDGRYRAVAAWRGVENANLSFSSTGIVDWGGGDKHTPIDVVMQALDLRHDFGRAVEWLKEKLGHQEPAIEIDFTRLVATVAAKKAAREFAGIDVEEDAPEVVAPVAHAPIGAPLAALDPFTPAAAGGLLGSISQWIFETARRPVPEFAVIGAISFLAALVGRRVVGPTGAGLNLYLVGIAGTGFGKEHSQKAIQTLAVDTHMLDLIGPSEVTSGTAIEKIVRKRPCFVMPWDEIGMVLQSVSGRGATSWSATIRKVLVELYSKSTSMWSGKEHADPTKDSSADPVFCPTVSLLGFSTPETFYAGLDEAALKDGFINRMMIIDVQKRPAPADATPQLVSPPSLIKAVKDAAQALPLTGNLGAFRMSNQRPTMHPVPWASPEAKAEWMAIEQWQHEAIDDGADAGIMNRAAENTIKLATLRAVSRAPAAPEVSVEDVRWGYAIVKRSIDSIEDGVKTHMAGSQFEELTKAIVAALKKNREGSLPMSVLVRARGVAKHDDRTVTSAINRLVLQGDIWAPQPGGKGQVRLVREAA